MTNHAGGAEQGATSVLESNWDGHSTRPAPRLYPHQWSWDSAFIAVGRSITDPSRAIDEIRSLFGAQWANGLVPHIVFAPDERDYFPSPNTWASRSCSSAPRSVDTSGICQPPVHATAVRMVADRLDDASTFVNQIFEPLCAWHEYLHRDRVHVGGLVELWHPWESGMDNSPVWDGPLEALSFAPGEVPEYERFDTTFADPGDRPTDREYDRYAYLLGRLRADGYAPTDPSTLPFRIHDVLFNSLLVRAERDLAAIATAVGADPAAHLDRAEALGEAIHARLWSEADGLHLNFDINTNAPIPARIGGAFAALLTDPPPSIVAAMLNTLQDSFLVPASPTGVVLPTVAVDDPAFESTRYWRGPAWINIMWLVALGLDRDASHLATSVRRGIIALVEQGGCAEYFDPVTFAGHGSDDFSWTAALFLDTIERLGAPHEQTPAARAPGTTPVSK